MDNDKLAPDPNLLTNVDVMREFPKVELHRHLEGTFDLPTLHAIALRNNLDVPADFAAFKGLVQFPKDSGPDFLKFLSKFKTDWYRNFNDISDITYNSVKNIKSDGLHYIELRFNPEHFALYNNFDRKTVTKTIVEQGNRAAKEISLHMKYLVTFNRMKQTASEMIRLYDEIRDLDLPDIVGIDLTGDEINYQPEIFADFFEYAHRDGKYLITIHAGEVSPSSQIWRALDLLYPKRIGHGTSAISDPRLQDALKSRGIVLEQCITSNYQTGSWVDEATHPLGRLYRSGVLTTINSDDPTIQDTSLSEDYVKSVRHFGFTVADLQRLNHIAIEGSFISNAEKASLLNSYDAALASFLSKYRLV